MTTKDICSNRHGGNPESRAAFNKISGHTAAQEAEILSLLASFPGGLISEQIEDALSLGRSSVSARISELKRRGLVGLKDIGDGKYERRRTRSGCTAAVVVSKVAG